MGKGVGRGLHLPADALLVHVVQLRAALSVTSVGMYVMCMPVPLDRHITSELGAPFVPGIHYSAQLQQSLHHHAQG